MSRYTTGQVRSLLGGTDAVRSTQHPTLAAREGECADMHARIVLQKTEARHEAGEMGREVALWGAEAGEAVSWGPCLTPLSPGKGMRCVPDRLFHSRPTYSECIHRLRTGSTATMSDVGHRAREEEES